MYRIDEGQVATVILARRPKRTTAVGMNKDEEPDIEEARAADVQVEQPEQLEAASE